MTNLLSTISFDFANYTYSGLLSIFAMIMGLAYPAIQSAIQNIDEKYGAGQLVERFTKESSYKVFKFSLIIAIIFSISSPFIQSLINKEIWFYIWGFFHTLVILFLLSSSISLFTSIMTYYRPLKLIEHFKKEREVFSHRHQASILADIANFGASKGQKEIYMAAEGEILSQLSDELKSVNYNIKSAPFNLQNPSTINSSLSVDMNRAIERLLEISTNPHYSSFYKTDTSVINSFYDIQTFKVPSNGIRNIIWRIVSEEILADNRDWFDNYWELANQYISFSANEVNNLNAKEKDIYKKWVDSFKEFHAAIGGMLIKYGKSAWLKDILFFTNTLPPKYPLLYNTFLEIISALDKIHNLTYPWYISANYPMKGINEGVRSDDVTMKYIEQFLALLYIRLWYLDYNVSYVDPKNKIKVTEDFNRNKHYIDVLNNLMKIVKGVFSQKLNKEAGLNDSHLKDVSDLITENISDFENKNKDIKDNPQIDNEKINNIVSDIESNKDKLNMVFFKHNRYDIIERFYTQLPVNLIPEAIFKGYNINVPDLGLSIIQGLNRKVNSFFPMFFLARAPKETYSIAYEYIGEALRKMNLNSKYSIICFGFNFDQYFSTQNKFVEAKESDTKEWTFNGSNVYEIDSQRSFIIIMNKDQMPFGDFIVENSETLDAITSSPTIYSNIKDIKQDDITNLIFKVYFEIGSLNSFPFVKINIPFVFTNNKFDLDKVGPVAKILD